MSGPAPRGSLLWQGQEVRPRSILAVHNQRIGDIVNFTPFLTALRRQFPEAAIAALVATPSQQVLSGNPDVDRVLVYDRNALRSPAAFAQFVGEIRALRADWAVVVHAAATVAWAIHLAGIPRRTVVWRYGAAQPPRGARLFNHRVVQVRDKTDCHEVEQNLRVLRDAGIEPAHDGLRLFPSPADHAAAQRLLADLGLPHTNTPTHPHKPLVAFHPGHAGGRQEWPPEHFAALGDRLVREAGAQIIVTGAPNEAERVQRVVASMREPAVDLAGRCKSLLELSALLGRCDLFVGVLTGPVHLAAAMGTPSVVPFGPTELMIDRVRFHPYGVPYREVVSPYACTCPRMRDCTEAPCMRSIAPDTAFEASLDLLREVAGNRVTHTR